MELICVYLVLLDFYLIFPSVFSLVFSISRHKNSSKKIYVCCGDPRNNFIFVLFFESGLNYPKRVNLLNQIFDV